MALSVVGVVASVLGRDLSSLSVMVEVEGDRENALRGPRCVSFSFLVSFHDMTKTALAGELIYRLFIYRVVCLDAALIRLWRVKLSNVEAV